MRITHRRLVVSCRGRHYHTRGQRLIEVRPVSCLSWTVAELRCSPNAPQKDLPWTSSQQSPFPYLSWSGVGNLSVRSKTTKLSWPDKCPVTLKGLIRCLVLSRNSPERCLPDCRLPLAAYRGRYFAYAQLPKVWVDQC
jgi:hypothetical protein